MSNIKIKNAIIVLLLMVLGVFYFYRLHYDGYADVFADEIVCNTPVYNNSFDIIPDYKLPADFPRYSVYGKSIIDGDFYVSMYNPGLPKESYIFIMSSSGDIKWYKKIRGYAYNFRKIKYNDGTIRYAYQQVDRFISEEFGLMGTHVVLMDEHFNVINNFIHPLKYGSITSENHGCENHEYKILSDHHYILTTVSKNIVTNIPGYEGEKIKVFNSIIQEQKDGKVIMQWESIDYPELYTASLCNNNYKNYKMKFMDFIIDKSTIKHTDYFHINAIAIDKNSGDLLISGRGVGLVKIDRDNGNIFWIMGRKKNNIKELDEKDIGLYQHDVKYLDDGSITIFDNSGGYGENSRVCRYWIDENNKTLIKKEIFDIPYKGKYMGSAELLDDDTDTYLICNGGPFEGNAFEERSFKNNNVGFALNFDNGNNLYRIFQGIESNN